MFLLSTYLGHAKVSDTYWLRSSARSSSASPLVRRRWPLHRSAAPSFPALVQEFFTDYLVRQRAVSPQTVVSYRDAFTLLLGFAEQRLGKPPTALQLSDIDRALLAGFLDHLERDRGNSVRTRNARLAAVRSFLKFAARRDVASLHFIEQSHWRYQ